LLIPEGQKNNGIGAFGLDPLRQIARRHRLACAISHMPASRTPCVFNVPFWSEKC